MKNQKLECKNGCVGCKNIATCPLHNHKNSVSVEQKLLDAIFAAHK